MEALAVALSACTRWATPAELQGAAKGVDSATMLWLVARKKSAGDPTGPLRSAAAEALKNTMCSASSTALAFNMGAAPAFVQLIIDSAREPEQRAVCILARKGLHQIVKDHPKAAKAIEDMRHVARLQPDSSASVALEGLT